MFYINRRDAYWPHRQVACATTRNDFAGQTLNGSGVSESKVTKGTIMRTILLSCLAIVLLGALSSCSTTVKTDNGHGVTAGVH